jgi:hypothetical protein
MPITHIEGDARLGTKMLETSGTEKGRRISIGRVNAWAGYT